MYATYLSNDNKLKLSKLKERLENSRDPKVQAETELMIQEITTLSKPYNKCDLEQSEELKSQLMQQACILQGLGKAQAAQVFLMYIKDVDFHIQSLKMQASFQEAAKLKPDQPPNLQNNRTPSLNQIDRDKKKQRRSFGGITRWTIDMDEEDELIGDKN